jgi:hypothetical protein
MKGNDMKKTPAIAAIGLAGFLGMAACDARVQVTPAPAPPAAPANSGSLAREIATIAVGKGGLTAFADDDGQATSAYCDPGMVSGPPSASTPTSASCAIRYTDGSVWKQTVTVAFASRGSPIAAWANLGTELVQPAVGDGPAARIRCARLCPD